jgi:hypothetical protein
MQVKVNPPLEFKCFAYFYLLMATKCNTFCLTIYISKPALSGCITSPMQISCSVYTTSLVCHLSLELILINKKVELTSRPTQQPSPHPRTLFPQRWQCQTSFPFLDLHFHDQSVTGHNGLLPFNSNNPQRKMLLLKLLHSVVSLVTIHSKTKDESKSTSICRCIKTNVRTWFGPFQLQADNASKLRQRFDLQHTRH